MLIVFLATKICNERSIIFTFIDNLIVVNRKKVRLLFHLIYLSRFRQVTKSTTSEGRVIKVKIYNLIMYLYTRVLSVY